MLAMRNLVRILALSTTAFAGSTIYLARELRLERAQSNASSAIAPRHAVEGNRPGAPVTRTAGPGVDYSAPAAELPAMVAGNPVSEAEIRQMQADYSRSFLAQLADPQRREDMLAEHRLIMRNTYPHVDQVLGLSPEEYARFLDLSARQLIGMQEASARCVVDLACELSDAYSEGTDPDKRELDGLLGPERARQLEAYKNTMGEREAVSQLRSRLPDALRLNDGKAEALITALAEERDLIHREAAQRGEAMNGFNIGAGMVFAPSEGGSLEDRFEVARQNSQRLRDRAAQYLNAEQRRAFDEMQEETLLGLRRVLRSKDGAPASMVDAVGPTN
jgi:hypothetical protein